MPLWTQFVDLVYATLVCTATALGGSMGLAIATVSFVVRLFLLPLTLKLAYRALETQVALKRLEPRLQKIRARYAKDQRRVLEETAKLYQEEGVRLVDEKSLLGTMVQAPVYLGLFGAIRRGVATGGRFLWVRDLALPDAGLAVLCAIVTASSAALGPQLSGPQRLPAILVPAFLTLVFLWRVAAGIGVYALASGLVGIVQAVLVRRRAVQLKIA